MTDIEQQIAEVESGAQAQPYVHTVKGHGKFTFRPLNKCGRPVWRAMAALEAEDAKPSAQVLLLFDLLEGLVAPAQLDKLTAADIDVDTATEIFNGWKEKQGPKAA